MPALEQTPHSTQEIDKVRRELAQRATIVPWMIEEPKGPRRLRQLA